MTDLRDDIILEEQEEYKALVKKIVDKDKELWLGYGFTEHESETLATLQPFYTRKSTDEEKKNGYPTTQSMHMVNAYEKKYINKAHVRWALCQDYVKISKEDVDRLHTRFPEWYAKGE